MKSKSSASTILSNFFSTKIKPDRLLSFVWTVICIHKKEFQTKSIDANLEISLIDYLKSNQHALIDIKQRLQNTIIPDEHFKWIENTRRQFNWIVNHITSSPGFVKHQILIPIHLSPKSQAIAYFDYWSGVSCRSMPHAISFLHEMRLKWESHIKMDSHFEWLNKDKKNERIGFFWKWLCSNKEISNINTTQFFSHEDVLIYFDAIRPPPSLIILINQNARRIWNQQQRRAQAIHKKQCNFILEKGTIEKLEEIAQYHRISRTQALEFLINAEHKNKYFINQLNIERSSTQPPYTSTLPTDKTM